MTSGGSSTSVRSGGSSRFFRPENGIRTDAIRDAISCPRPFSKVACKRADARSEETRTAFDSKRTMPDALSQTIAGVDCELLVIAGSPAVVAATVRAARRAAPGGGATRYGASS